MDKSFNQPLDSLSINPIIYISPLTCLNLFII